MDDLIADKVAYRHGIGPGGISCPCCNPYNCHPRNMKHLVRRKLRRKNRQLIKNLED